MTPWKSLFMRAVAAVVVITFGGMVTAPAAAAMQEGTGGQTQAGAAAPDDVERLSAAVVETREELRRLAGRPDPDDRVATLEERRVARERLKALRTQVRELDAQTRAEFARVGELVTARNLPPVIVERHAAALAEYQARADALLADLDVIETGDEPAAFARAEAAFDRIQDLELERGHQPFDPENLPNRSLQPVEGLTPKLLPEEYITADEVLDLSRALAANEDFGLSGLVGADDAGYLAPTPEVTLSDAIHAKAAELNHHPLQIYNWVRNNVQWQPYWGAVQDADLTLSAQRGTAMDIASLTIALLRVSGIPARYAHGAIELPEDQFRNWIGGFEHINAAIHFAASGGIPIAGVTSGGAITRVRMQHVWVEAAVDFFPSRGAVNRAADSWVPMDPSFKQYEFLEGLDPVAISGLDPEALANTFLASGTVNEAEGWVTGFDPAVLQDAQLAAAQALEDHIATHLPDATVGDVLGGRRIVEHAPPIFAGTLATEVLTVGARHASLPDSLHQHMTFALAGGHSVTLRWPEINNERITLSFRPATTADEQALLSLLPEGVITDISQLPGSIPAYLVRVVPELKIEDEVILTGDALNLGSEVRFSYTPRLAGGRTGAANPYDVIAGSYLAVAAIAGNVAIRTLQNTQQEFEKIASTLVSDDAETIQSITRDDILGTMFHAGLVAYYGQYNSLAKLTGQSSGGHHYLGAGLGTFGYEPYVSTVLGMPMSIRPGGAILNIPILNVFGFDSAGNVEGNQRRFNYIFQTGIISSALEHTVPEQLLVDGDTPGEAFSAARALEKAQVSGQRIYQITQENRAQTLPNIFHSGLVMNEIKAAIAAGREVITHTRSLSVPGWSGAGYIIFDPINGDGAFKIGGGFNGTAKKLTSGAAVMSAGALGYVDGAVGDLLSQEISFSERLKYLQRLARMSQVLGGIALLIGLAFILTDDTLSTADKIGQMSMLVLTFGITTYVTSAVVAVLGAGSIWAIGIAVMTALAMATSVLYINAVYFSSLGRARPAGIRYA